MPYCVWEKENCLAYASGASYYSVLPDTAIGIDVGLFRIQTFHFSQPLGEIMELLDKTKKRPEIVRFQAVLVEISGIEPLTS